MKKVFCLVSCLFFIQSSLACDKSNVLEDVSVPEQKEGKEGVVNLISITEGIKALCTIEELESNFWEKAFVRMEGQKNLLEIIFKENLIDGETFAYYEDFFKSVESNLVQCEKEARKIRRKQKAPRLLKLVDLDQSRSNGVVSIFFKEEVDGPTVSQVTTHKSWFGRVVELYGYNLCQTTILNSI